VTYSALTGDGIAKLWTTVLDHRERMTASGELAARRRAQQVKWMWAMLEDRVFGRLRSDPALKAKLPRIEAAVAEGRMSPAVAVDEIAAALGL
jgi:LAO/AO transport system kinase